MQIDDKSGPNIPGVEGIHVNPKLGIRSEIIKGTDRALLQKIPDTIYDDLARRLAEVEFAKESIRGDIGKYNLRAKITEYKSKYKGIKLDPKRLKLIQNNPNHYLKQTGINANAAILNQQDLATPAGFKKFVTKSLNEAQERVARLNKFLYPEGMGRKDIVRSMHFAHGQGLASGGAHFGGSYAIDNPYKNVTEGSKSGITAGKLDPNTKRYVTGDAYSAINHPQFWDDAMVNYIMGDDSPIMIELTDEAKQKIMHKGYDADRIIIEEDRMLLNSIDEGDIEIPYRKGEPVKTGTVIDVHKNTAEVDARELNEWLDDIKVDGWGDKIARRRAIATGATLGSITALGAVGAPFSVAGAAERLEIAQQTGKPTDYLAAGLEGVSAVGDVSGPGGEILATGADLALLGMDAPQTYEALMHRSDPEVELAKQEQKEQDSVTSYTAQVGMDPQQRLIERSNIRQQQYKDKLTAHQKGREQEKQWQLQGQDYVTQTQNPLERLNNWLHELVR